MSALMLFLSGSDTVNRIAFRVLRDLLILRLKLVAHRLELIPHRLMEKSAQKRKDDQTRFGLFNL